MSSHLQDVSSPCAANRRSMLFAPPTVRLDVESTKGLNGYAWEPSESFSFLDAASPLQQGCDDQVVNDVCTDSLLSRLRPEAPIFVPLCPVAQESCAIECETSEVDECRLWAPGDSTLFIKGGSTLHDELRCEAAIVLQRFFRLQVCSCAEAGQQHGSESSDVSYDEKDHHHGKESGSEFNQNTVEVERIVEVPVPMAEDLIPLTLLLDLLKQAADKAAEETRKLCEVLIEKWSTRATDLMRQVEHLQAESEQLQRREGFGAGDVDVFYFSSKALERLGRALRESNAEKPHATWKMLKQPETLKPGHVADAANVSSIPMFTGVEELIHDVGFAHGARWLLKCRNPAEIGYRPHTMPNEEWMEQLYGHGDDELKEQLCEDDLAACGFASLDGTDSM